MFCENRNCLRISIGLVLALGGASGIDIKQSYYTFRFVSGGTWFQFSDMK